MRPRKQATDIASIPDLTEDDQYREAQARVSRIRSQIQQFQQGGTTEPDRQDMVDALVRGDTPPDEPQATRSPSWRDLQKASEQAERELSRARVVASERIVEPLVPHHQEMVRRLDAALKDLAAAAEDIHKLQRRLEETGACWVGVLTPIRVDWLRSGDPQNRISALRDEIEQSYPGIRR